MFVDIFPLSNVGKLREMFQLVRDETVVTFFELQFEVECALASVESVVLSWVVLCCVVLCWIVAFREVECALADCVFNQPQSNLDCQFEPLPFENYNSLETGNIRNMNTGRIWVLVWNTRSRNCLVWSSVVWNEIFRCYFQWKTFGQIVTLSLTWPPLGCLGLNQLRFYQNLLQQILSFQCWSTQYN